MNKQIVAFALILSSLLAAPALADCRYTADRSARIEGDGIRKVVVAAGAGDLVVRGDDSRKGVVVEGRACADKERDLEQIQLETRREGDTVYVKTLMPEWEDRLFRLWDFNAYLDLTVSVPKSAVLDVEDSSGDLELRDVQSAVIADSSGDQNVQRIAGDLDVTDSSGEIDVDHVTGNLRLKDSSGDVDLRNIQGNVEVSVDSSGDLTIGQVGGEVHIVNDSSGDIEIVDVQRNVTIDSDSSGSIHVDRVGGDFTVGSDGSGGISHQRVVGAVHVPDDDEDD